MTRDALEKLVVSAIDLIVEREPQLLELDVTERALSHQLARYLSELVPDDYDVDCEYNRHLTDPKRLNLPKRNALDRELRATTVFPDVIVHRRNTDEHNLLVLEMKKSDRDLEYDNLKLQAFRNELGYRYTAHVILGRAADGKIDRRVIWVDG